jgi:hypothetical protein
MSDLGSRSRWLRFATAGWSCGRLERWGISKLDALGDLSNGRAWLPPGPEPTG